MSQPTTEASGARRHIIKRPRLTRLLDESSARIILLVAPAGYGKTTLAREWCDHRNGTIVWYRAGPSAQDVVALATNLSSVVEDVLPGSGGSLRTYLRGIDSGEVDVQALAGRLADDLDSWPEDAVLVIDDYQYARGSETSDMFVGLVAEHAPLRLLLATRVAPRWASARHFVYGQMLQIDRAQLAMTESEVDRALSGACPDEAGRIRALAGGWPAVIGLAALTSVVNPPPAAIAETLHAYFAQELFDTAEPRLQAALITLAVLPRISHALATAALDEEPADLLREADRVGFITPRDAAYELHPLLREFLLTKTSLLCTEELSCARERVLETLITDRHWDDAFALIEESEMIFALPGLLRAGLDDLLREGRIATVRSWLRLARRLKFHDPVLDLADSESSLRAGQLAQARFFAIRALRHLDAKDDRLFRTLCLAGLAAGLADDYLAACDYYKRAETVALSPAQTREALWGQFSAAFHLEREESESILHRFQSVAEEQTPDDLLRVAIGRFRTTCLTNTSLRAVLVEMSATANFVELASNPHAICSFLLVHAQCAMLTAEYSKALQLAKAAWGAADRYGLKFALPYSSGVESFALFGLTRFKDAKATIDRLVREAEELGDVLSLVNASVAEARLLLANGELTEAVRTTDDGRFRTSTLGMHGESLAIHSLALACAGELARAQTVVARARAVSRAVETESTALAAEAVIALQGGRERDALLRFLHHLRETQHYDAFVAAYRAHPPLLVESAATDFRDLINEIVVAAGDRCIASSFGIVIADMPTLGPLSASDHQLSPREFEVLGLVASGLSNNAIAGQLYISEATVKVHLRHIFEKLNVRSRTQAALHPAGRRARYATSDMGPEISTGSDAF
ncbi:MAG TPA: LuxR C-terminal-related transcriptional regulator [Gaiellaceae bacterium]|jgi:ATP/maltotriose-dependent transcriptional regulator MalT|nr:LuxR C-terminal-related transcriptional regulator [Gaiellaceae bacterium]